MPTQNLRLRYRLDVDSLYALISENGGYARTSELIKSKSGRYISEKGLRRWATRVHSPRLDSFLDFCFALQASPSDLLESESA